MCYKNVGTSFFRFVTQIMRLTDRRTDGQTDSCIVTRPPCIQCSAVKMTKLCRFNQDDPSLSAFELQAMQWQILATCSEILCCRHDRRNTV